MKNTKIIIVTGCLGFMSSYFVRSCLSRNWKVIGIDKIDVVSNINLIEEFKQSKNFKFIKQDINDLQELYDCDIIVNFAASSHVNRSFNSSKQFLHDNVNGIHNILELIRLQPIDKMPLLVNVSTDETYGDIGIGSHTELDLLKPSNPYSASKACGDMLILAWARTFKIPYIIVRPTNNYGVGQYPEKLIPKTIKYLTLGRKIPLHNHGTPRRVWLHAQDTTDAILTIIDSGKQNEIYNVSGNWDLPNVEIVTKIIKLFKGNPDLYNLYDPESYCDFGYSRSGQDMRYSLDDSKLKKLGWTPKKVFDEELPKIVEYYKNNFIW